MTSGIDWLAVDFAVNGSKMVTLTADERRMVIRRLKINGEGCNFPPVGTITVDQAADRLGIADRSVVRIKADLPEAVTQRCPVCGNTMWVLLEDGVVEAHPDNLHNECPLSGYYGYDHHDLTALTVLWFAKWFRSDQFGCAKHILDGIDEARARELLIAAVAAMPDKTAEELFAWTVAS